ACYYYTITGETDTVELNIVEDEDAPTAVKVTFAGDLAESYDDYYILSTNSTYFWLTSAYENLSVTNADVKINYEYTDESSYAIYPNEGATEVVITATKKAAGTLAVTGATDQVVSIQMWDSETGEYVDVAAGDTVEANTYLYVTLKQGYVIEENSWYEYLSDNETEYAVYVGGILADGVATLNVVQGAVLAYAGDVENGKSYGMTEGRTLVVNSSILVDTANGHVIDVDGGEITYTYYYCDSETGEVSVEYVIMVTSAGTMTVTFREAEEGELPTSIKVNYTGETDGLSDTSYGNAAYVMPGDYFSLRLEDGYTAEVTGATLYYYYTTNRVSFYIDEDATEVTVNIVKIAEESTLKVVGDETVEDVSQVVVDATDTVTDGDALESGLNTFRVVNGYEIKGVTGAVYYESGYVADSDGNIYLEYILIPTDDPAEVTVTVGLTAEWVTVTLINDTDYNSSIYGGYWEQVSSNVYKSLSTDTLYVRVYKGYTVKVTGGTVVNVDATSVTGYDYFEIEINEGVTDLTIEIISVDDLTADQAEKGYIDSTNDPDQQAKPDDKPDDQPDSKPDAKPDGEKAPDTGDETNVTLWAALVAVFAASAGAVLTVLKKKEN
ncbi:MAG: LPXTG cell wall anchor domain-containing protein, partial [Oscillospiraceae bacterium]|nr:LPXTG cell wall anchor domain-containing protein [Oscillospiraceae bacterium]